jgi:pyruvate dehydrogenase E2 component (dihydrolipoamide acetyltransferase)
MTQLIKVPDIGDFDAVEVIEVLVAVGDEIKAEDTIITLESEKATLEVPSPVSGIVKKILVKVGDEISQGSDMLEVEVTSSSENKADEQVTKKEEQKPVEKNLEEPKKAEPKQAESKQDKTPVAKPQAPVAVSPPASGKIAHASPAIRRFARELGADINLISGTGRKARITRDDVVAFIKQALSSGSAATNTGSNFEVLPPPSVDFSQFGEIETQELSRIQKISGKYLHRNWVRIPHVTQFDEADITEMEAFRQENKDEAKAQGYSLTPLAFIVKAVAVALKKFPAFNASLDESGENLILKKYFHVGIAVDTPNGLVVPVIRDVNLKSVTEIAQEMGQISIKARDGKLSPNDMKGGCFSVSSLGGIGGTAFTPIINAPEVAILGVSRSKVIPRYNKKGYIVPSLMFPLSLSYYHLVIDFAKSAIFTFYIY